MNLNAWLTILRLPNLGAQLGIARDAEALVRLHFLYAAATSGLLKPPSGPTAMISSSPAGSASSKFLKFSPSSSSSRMARRSTIRRPP